MFPNLNARESMCQKSTGTPWLVATKCAPYLPDSKAMQASSFRPAGHPSLAVILGSDGGACMISSHVSHGWKKSHHSPNGISCPDTNHSSGKQASSAIQAIQPAAHEHRIPDKTVLEKAAHFLTSKPLSIAVTW